MNATHHTPDHDEADGPFATRLRDRLDAEVGDLPAGRGPASAVARARARRRSRRTALASLAALALVAGVVQLRPDDPGRAEVTTAAEQAVVDQTLTFDWTVADDGLAHVPSHSVGESGMYAISTAPRTRYEDHPDGEVPRAMYRLSDDGTWSPIALEGDDPKVATVSERGGTLYALSTAPASSADGGPTGSMSTDGGETWSSVPLEAPTPPSDAVAWNLSYALDIASTADRTIALVSASVHVPYEELFPEMSSDDGPGYHTEVTEDGIDLVRSEDREPGAEVESSGRPVEASPTDSEADAVPSPSATRPPATGDVVRTVTWADLGISGAHDLAPQRWAYAADGGEWTEITVPSTDGTAPSQSARLDTVGDRFLLTVQPFSHDGEPSAATTHLSADGQDWTTTTGPGSGELLATGDALLHVGHSAGGNVDLVQVSRDLGSTWTPVDLRSLDPALEGLPDDRYVQASTGPLGAALLVHRGDEQASPLMLFSTDLTAWTVTDLAGVLPDGATLGGAIVGTDRVVLLGHTSDGEPGSPERSATVVGVPRRG